MTVIAAAREALPKQVPSPRRPPARDARRRLLSVASESADNNSVEVVSPELVLVDPLLRTAALAALPEPGDCLASGRPAPVAGFNCATAASLVLRTGNGVDAPTPAGGTPDDAIMFAARDVEPETTRHAGTSLRMRAALLGVFLFAYFLGSPLLEFIADTAQAALPA